MQELEPLSRPAEKLLMIMKFFRGKQVTLKDYAMMLGISRRRIRIIVSELRAKKYIKVHPQNMKVANTSACKYTFLDEKPEAALANISQDILDRLKIQDE